MKIKKISGIALIFVLISFLLSVSACAKSYADEVKEIYNSLDSETQELLKDIGADSVDLNASLPRTRESKQLSALSEPYSV